MKIIGIFVICLTLFCTTAHCEEPLKFAQIVDTPDQMVGAEILNVAYKRLGIPIVTPIKPKSGLSLSA
jgi:polar amino acid transport system substrate-binding protein